jgi:hypothetical protein
MNTPFKHLKVKKLRINAYKRQNCRCYYCNRLMWEGSPNRFTHENAIPASEVEQRRSTAEHLQARQDGGKNTRCNIVAACRECNHGRHAGRADAAPEPDDFKQEVRSRMAACASAA